MDQMDQVLIYKMGTALMPGEIERSLRQVRGREWEKGRREGTRSEGREGWRGVTPTMAGSTTIWDRWSRDWKEKSKALLSTQHKLAPGIPLQRLGSSYKGVFLMPFLALGEWLVLNLENSYLKGFYLNSCA